MTGNYRVERIRKRLMVASGFMVAAYSLHWSGILSVQTSVSEALNSLYLTSYDLSMAEAVMVNAAQRLSSLWMDVAALSALGYAALFASFLFLSWRLLPRRAATAAAAAGMFATYLLALPFAPGDAILQGVTGKPLSHYVGGKPSIDMSYAAFSPLGGGLPWVGIEARAADDADRAVPGPSVTSDRAAAEFVDRFVTWAYRAKAFVTAMGLLIGIGFWSTFLGLAVLSLKRGGERPAAA